MKKTYKTFQEAIEDIPKTIEEMAANERKINAGNKIDETLKQVFENPKAQNQSSGSDSSSILTASQIWLRKCNLESTWTREFSPIHAKSEAVIEAMEEYANQFKK